METIDSKSNQKVETVPFSREVDAFRFIKEELAKGHSVTIWPVSDQAYTLAAQSNKLIA